IEVSRPVRYQELTAVRVTRTHSQRASGGSTDVQRGRHQSRRPTTTWVVIDAPQIDGGLTGVATQITRTGRSPGPVAVNEVSKGSGAVQPGSRYEDSERGPL